MGAPSEWDDGEGAGRAMDLPRSCRVLAAIAALAGPATVAKADLPILRIWPGGEFPCNTTLQACVDGAGPGDGIRIATDGPINESISFQKCLTLKAAPGFHPL